jgi:two-component system, NtrC family, response regulator
LVTRSGFGRKPLPDFRQTADARSRGPGGRGNPTRKTANIARGLVVGALAPRLRGVADVSEIDSVPIGAGADKGHRDTGFSPDSVVVGRSRRMRAVFDFLRVIAGSESNVLIIGETGTGKEVVARLIHHDSGRRRGPFVAVSCAILTESLIESELFGHERGAFTGAIKDRPGRFEMASGGTIFLDDVDDVPPAMQVKLLRVVQERVVERVGGTRPIPIDVRVITGSKRSLRRMVAEGRFREDLFYRLNVLPIWLPPLRERREDIPALTDYFMAKFFRQSGHAPALSDTVKQLLQRYSWPGNVRELENACERLAQTCTCDRIRCACMPASILFQSIPDRAPLEGETWDQSHAVFLDERLRDVETNLIAWALKTSHGNKSRAAELLQIKRSTLGDRIRRLGLDEQGGQS